MKEMKPNEFEVFIDLINELNEEDIEFINAHYLDEDSSAIDCINQLVFRKFNDIITNEEIEAIIKKYESPYDFATFKTVILEDCVIVFAYI